MLHGDAAGRSLNDGVTAAGAASQCTSVDVTAAAAAATAVDKRREAASAMTDTETAVQCIRLDELAPVLEHTTDN